ncbi:MAG: XamI family restriction endonuclease [Chloroflexales bacterium]
MAVNADKPHLWKQDVAQSVDFYNQWFMQFAPLTYRETRITATQRVKIALQKTSYLMNITPSALKLYPESLETLRMSTAPPLARDRLIGLASVSSNLVKSMEDEAKIPPHMSATDVDVQLAAVGKIIHRMADRDIFPWLDTRIGPSPDQIERAATIVADRLCGAAANPIIRNEQERRQLTTIESWLKQRGYIQATARKGVTLQTIPRGSYAFRFNTLVYLSSNKAVNIPIDAVVMPMYASADALPLLIEAKSAGDFTNTNKRRKEEAVKMAQLKKTYGDNVSFILFLCGYFDSGYLGYEAAEGIDWVWEHRINDLVQFGL